MLTLAVGCSKPSFSELKKTEIGTGKGDEPIEKRPPRIVWVQQPGDTTAGSDVTIEYDIIPGTSPISVIECKVDGVVVPCSADGDTIVVEDVQPGDHNVSIVVISEDDLQDSAEDNWLVEENPQQHRPPSIVLLQVPDDRPTGSNVTVTYNVIPGTSPVVSTECKLNSEVISCKKDGDKLIFKNVQAGKYKFEVAAVDENNLQDYKQAGWLVFDNFQKVQQPVQVADVPELVDVLVVVDNTRSMSVERENMGSKIDKFLEPLKGLDWRVGVILTDARELAKENPVSGSGKITINGDGQLQKFANGNYWLSSDMSIADAKEQFKSVVIRRENYGWHEEQGIMMATRSVQKYLNPSEKLHSVHKNFFRDKAALSVIVISDEDESYDGTHFPGSDPKTHGAKLVALVKSTWGANKLFQFHSIITRPGDKACKENSNANQYGYNYNNFSLLTEGTVGNVCAKDYSEQLQVLGQDISKPNTKHKLTCVPMDINNDGRPDVTVSSSTNSNVPSFSLDGDELNFSERLPPGDYSINYFCPKN